MLSHNYRVRLENICRKIVNGTTVELSEMIWAEKLAKANTTARTWLAQARRKAENPDMVDGSMDDFLNHLNLGDRKGVSGFDTADDILEWFQREKPDDWLQRD